MGIQFIYPQFLLLLFVLPLFVIIYFSSFYYNKKKSINFPNFEAMQRVFGAEIFSRNFLSLYFSLIILALIILSIAGTIITYSGAASFVIAIDNSESMKTADVLPSRLDVAKSSADDFVDSLQDSEIGVIEFSGNVNVIQTPDSSKIKTKLAIDSIIQNGIFGTDFQEVLYSANILLEGREKKYLVVLSDGQINFADINRTIKYARDNNIIISSIVIGTETGGLTESGTVSKIEEYSLQKLSFETEGKYVRAEDIDSLELAFRGLLVDSQSPIRFNISDYLLMVALFLFVLNWLMQNFRFRSIP